MSSSELHTLQPAFTDAGGHWSTFVIWAKDHFTLGRSDYQRQYEPILYGWREGAEHHWCGDRDQGDVWLIDRPAKNDLHPTMKPVELVERAIRNSAKRSDLVLDPFGGIGHDADRRRDTGPDSACSSNSTRSMSTSSSSAGSGSPARRALLDECGPSVSRQQCRARAAWYRAPG